MVMQYLLPFDGRGYFHKSMILYIYQCIYPLHCQAMKSGKYRQKDLNSGKINQDLILGMQIRKALLQP